MELAQSLNIELLYLTADSPNLNLLERLWKFVKKQCLYSIYYADFNAFKQAISLCLEQCHTTHKRELASLLTLRYVRQMHQEQGKDKTMIYVNQTVRAACQQSQEQGSNNRRQRDMPLELPGSIAME
jgi:DDE superfamily endonuclease